MDHIWSPDRREDRKPRRLFSPTHQRTVDAAFCSLRRSLSRSPSKIRLTSCSHSPKSAYHHPTYNSMSNTPPSPLFGTPQQVQVRSLSQPNTSKRPRPNLRRSAPLSNLSQSNTPARSPTRRALSITSDNGNSAPASSQNSSGDGQENEPVPESSTTPPLSLYKISKPTIFDPQRTMSPTIRPRGREFRPAKSSPLKRTDATMNLARDTSPAAKRRTICAGVISSPFDSQEIMDLAQSGDEQPPLDETFGSSLAPRSPFLRIEGGSTPLRRSLELPTESSRRSRSSARPRSRLFDVERTGPFRYDRPAANGQPLGSGLDAKRQGFEFARPKRPAHFSRDQLTFADSPAPKQRSAPLDFSKSLPVGALRPGDSSLELEQAESKCSQKSSNDSFETPKLYKMARPNPAAFRSTGLISKKHRNLDDVPPPPAAHPGMPDTPCKRGPLQFAFGASPEPEHSAFKDHRFAQPSFGTPSKPFNPHGHRQSSGSFGQGSGVFGSSLKFESSDSSAVLFGSEGDKNFKSPPRKESQSDSQSSADDYPPTPTRLAPGHPSMKSNSLRSNLLGRRQAVAADTFQTPGPSKEEGPAPNGLSQGSSCKSPLSQTLAEFDGAPVVDTQSAARMISLSNDPSTPSHCFAKARLLRQMQRKRTVSPLCKQSLRSRNVFAQQAPAKQPLLVPVYREPLTLSTHGLPPETPVAESALPDPSGLSISAAHRHLNPVSPTLNLGFGNTISFTPATPTHRDGETMPFLPHPIVTPSNHNHRHDVDHNLNRRFKKVEWYGRGEFSEVYKVFETSEQKSYFSPTMPFTSSQQTPGPDRVYIVKKSKVPYSSSKLRQRVLREASIMRALGRNDHVVNLVDSFEASGHLYIQTEFCEEGSLETFLAKAGNKGRLDDFRIWKILIELSEGLGHIHNNGFMHLDLKPANVFINFAGTLKIGDFGLASEWPAPKHVEGEGDRRYIGPDLLQGCFDKPADIFALGMIMFEIAGNCILPDNGTSWQQLRSGDWSDLPSLTSGSTHSIFRDSQDELMTAHSGVMQGLEGRESNESLFRPETHKFDANANATPSFGIPPSSIISNNNTIDAFDELEVATPPRFMLVASDPEALESVVHWMMRPFPEERPVVSQILESGGCRWVDERRRAGAVVFEGNWGPPAHVLRAGEELDNSFDSGVAGGSPSKAPEEDGDCEMLDG